MTCNYDIQLSSGALGRKSGKKKGGGLAIDVSSGPVFLSKKRRIGMDISSGLIFLTHTKKTTKMKS